MNARVRLDAELDRLAGMLPVWREKLRHEAQFWPQFAALAGEILATADAEDLPHARRRIEAMLREADRACPLPRDRDQDSGSYMISRTS